jgi:hypothetical protein
MQSRVFSQKQGNLFATMNRRIVPHQDNLPGFLLQQSAEEFDDLHTGEIALVQLSVQANATISRRQNQSPDGVDTLPMVETRADDRRASARCPTAPQGRNQRKATFIEKNEFSLEFISLFLSAATDSVSSALSLRHRALSPRDALSDNSSPFDPGCATHRWECTVHERGPKSDAQSGQVSSSHLHTPGQKHPSKAWLSVERLVCPTGLSVSPQRGIEACVCRSAGWLPLSSTGYYVW